MDDLEKAKNDMIAALGGEGGDGEPGPEGSTGDETGTPASETGTGDGDGQPGEGGEPTKHSVGGKEYTEEEILGWQKGNMLDGDYRKKTSEIAETRKRFAPWTPTIELLEDEMRKTGGNPNEILRKLLAQGGKPPETPEFDDESEKKLWEMNQKLAEQDKTIAQLGQGISDESYARRVEGNERKFKDSFHDLCEKKDAKYPFANRKVVYSTLYFNSEISIEDAVKLSHDEVKAHDQEVIAKYTKGKAKPNIMGTGGGGTSPASQKPPTLKMEDGTAQAAFIQGLKDMQFVP